MPVRNECSIRHTHAGKRTLMPGTWYRPSLAMTIPQNAHALLHPQPRWPKMHLEAIAGGGCALQRNEDHVDAEIHAMDIRVRLRRHVEVAAACDQALESGTHPCLQLQ